MKKAAIIFLLVFILSENGIAQMYQLKGLEIYNPALINPAFVVTDRIIQADVISFDNGYSRGSNAWMMFSIPDSKSAVGISYGKSRLDWISHFAEERSDSTLLARSNSFALSYSYKHSFSDDLLLSGGLRYTQGYTHFMDTSRINTLSSIGGRFEAGIGLNFKKLYAGISMETIIFSWKKILDDSDTPQTSWSYFNTFNTSFIAGYRFSGRRRVNFDPIIGFNHHIDLNAHVHYSGFYAGGNISIVKTFGLGFTVGNMNSLSTSITIKDRVSLMLGIISIEKAKLSYGQYTSEYSLGFDPLNYIMQLRVKL